MNLITQKAQQPHGYCECLKCQNIFKDVVNEPVCSLSAYIGASHYLSNNWPPVLLGLGKLSDTWVHNIPAIRIANLTTGHALEQGLHIGA